MRRILFALSLSLLSAGPALAGQASRFDWRPLLAAPFVVADPVTTERFLASDRCTEANDRYWGYSDFTPEHPDTKKMWRDAVFGLGVVAGTTYFASRAKVRWAHWVAKGGVYYLGARKGYSTVRNLRLCGRGR